MNLEAPAKIESSIISDVYAQVGPIGIILASSILFCIVLCIIFLKNKQNPIIVRIAKSTHSAYGQILLASMGIMWASVISVFGSNLQGQWFNGKVWEVENLLFGLPVILALTISVLHYIYSQIKENQSHVRPSFNAINECSAQSVNIINVVSNCILDLQKIISTEKKSRGEIIGQNSKRDIYNETLENAIKICMESILLVTKKFVEGNDEITVKSNIFNLIPSNAAQNEFLHRADNISSIDSKAKSIFNKESIENSPFFLFSTNLLSRLEHCEYLLVCEQTFTCELNRKNEFSICSGQKNDTAPICMPVSFNQNINKNTLSHPNLFGAPESITRKREVYIENISDSVDIFIKDLKKSTSYRDYLTVNYENKIRSYYENDKDKPKSLLSIPLSKLDLKAEKLDIPNDSAQHACVLNIYVDRVNFLENELKSEAFYKLIKPLCHSLSAIISLKILYANMIKDYVPINENDLRDVQPNAVLGMGVVKHG